MLSELEITLLGFAFRVSDDDAVQDTFVQQRGHTNNRNGETGDVRQLRENGVLDAPISGPREVS